MLSTEFQEQQRRPSALRELLAWFFWLTMVFVVVPMVFWMLPIEASLSVLIVASSLYAMHRLVGLFNFNRVAIPNFFFWIYLALILTPGFFIFADENTPSRWQFLVGIESILVTVPLGIWLAKLTYGAKRSDTEDFFSRPLTDEILGPSEIRLYLLFLVAAGVLIVVNFIETPVIPLFFLIRNPGEFLAAAALREDSFKLFQSHLIYVYYVLRGAVFPFLIIVAFGRYRKGRQKVWRRLFWISLILGVFYASLTIEKSPVAAIVGLLFVFYYLYRSGRFGTKIFVAAPIVFLAFPIVVVLLGIGGKENGAFLLTMQVVASRIFYGPAQVVYAYFEIFPRLISYQHGAGIAKLAYFMGWRSIDIPNAVGLYMVGTKFSSVSANGCFIGALNADFGLTGVFVGGILAGYLMEAANLYFFRKPKTVVSLAAYALCMWAFGELSIWPLPTALLSGGVFFALLLFWIFRSTGYQCRTETTTTIQTSGL